MQQKNVVMWLFAEDRPLSKNVDLLQDRSIDERRQQWVTYHDMKTAGIMGLQPLVRDVFHPSSMYRLSALPFSMHRFSAPPFDFCRLSVQGLGI